MTKANGATVLAVVQATLRAAVARTQGDQSQIKHLSKVDVKIRGLIYIVSIVSTTISYKSGHINRACAWHNTSLPCDIVERHLSVVSWRKHHKRAAHPQPLHFTLIGMDDLASLKTTKMPRLLSGSRVVDLSSWLVRHLV